MPAQSDKIHAVWFCLQVPYAQGRLIDAVDEALLRLELYGLPIIVVFTKYDLLISAKEKDVCSHPKFKDWDDKVIFTRVDSAVKKEYDDACVGPLTHVVGRHSIPIAKASICDPESLSNLLHLTCDHARRRIREIEAEL